MFKILIVDDAGYIQVRIKTVFKPYKDINLVFANNGSQAYDQYKMHNPDMVFMDISMPDIDGIEATKNIKNDFPDAKICMLTAEGSIPKVKTALAAGAQDFVVKPFDAEKLIKTVEKTLGISLGSKEEEELLSI